ALGQRCPSSCAAMSVLAVKPFFATSVCDPKPKLVDPSPVLPRLTVYFVVAPPLVSVADPLVLAPACTSCVNKSLHPLTTAPIRPASFEVLTSGPSLAETSRNDASSIRHSVNELPTLVGCRDDGGDANRMS